MHASAWAVASRRRPQIHKIMQGLLDAHLLAGNAQALEVVSAMADYHHNRTAKVTSATRTALEHSCGGTPMAPALQLLRLGSVRAAGVTCYRKRGGLGQGLAFSAAAAALRS